ncbi:hypothetical protein AJ79_07658 [Helicocarpus griseus UAMH5409]|uniref:Beta-lactamase-related domain-containing protein n=1 Tax=Helicocarpus griseus UAMH5409 TaxID=1447875 RepID=A0A2B7X0A9_9EURO|nr:hypothetical protein AJ79_07658 [Helicocarpus griseus UAMH5409]
MAEVQGFCDEAFEPVRTLMQQYLDSGEELGASVFVDWNGKSVVDLWGGFCDKSRTQPWIKNTITNVWSISKTVTNLAALVLVDRGLLGLNEKVATYWPEFGQNGKENIEVRHILSHTSGVSGWDTPFSTEDMYDLETSASRLAKQAPWWEPGTASGYHAHNQGHLVGELVRRVTGKSLQQFVAEEISGPLKADFRFGALESEWGRVSDIFPPEEVLDMEGLKALDPSHPAYRTFTGPFPNAAAANTAQWRKAELGALNGHGNARSVARILSTVSLEGEANGLSLLSPNTVNRIFEEQANGVDLVLGKHLRFGNGYGLPCSTVPHIPEGRVCYWGGWGGSIIMMDLDKRLTICYVMNKMRPGTLGSPQGVSYVRAIYDSIRQTEGN